MIKAFILLIIVFWFFFAAGKILRDLKKGKCLGCCGECNLCKKNEKV